MSVYSITTTLPYVNADPHIGFALEIVQADMLARYYRGRGFDVVFNTGTDEHGQKIYQKAQEAGIDPKTYCDEYAAKFDGLKQALNLTYTHFIRTTDAKHIAAAQAFWTKCQEVGDIYKKQYSVKYCVGCELEKTDSELVDGRCPVHPNRELDHIEEENYFFKFSNYQEKLLALYKERPDFVVPHERLNEIRTFVEGGLNDFSISRLKTKMPWGVPVPNDPDHVMYVWFDALVNYISTLDWPSAGSLFETAWPSVQVAGKDNLRQQSAMWQAMLMSVGIEPSKQVFIHGYITANGQKMSKSIGNVINPYDLVAEYGTDATRMYLLGVIPSWQDGDYSKEQFEILYASKLANGIGNLVSRVAAMANKSFPSGLDRVVFDAQEKDTACDAAIKAYDFKAYVECVMSVVDAANEKIEKEAPFRTVKTDEAAAKKSLSELAGMIRWIGAALAPVMPVTADEIVRRYQNDSIEVGPALFPRRDA
ncbi:MAG: Methionine-tRNA ligase [Candidatus Uhrbacteria bacterium GW2011_GWD2_52_7]|uniref:Methionine--tRNA ligase n=1 Tax=Candidatus Uhrbacteria bacterium GW2011_GWD2_52_7 TaxID=1618989 RepID=A0A0G1XGR2_9BACT|nr:MAG: Methionine-tRNA ligase [Candidatus Uhrbacteria bacterium GW2011_GWD2_52_7]